MTVMTIQVRREKFTDKSTIGRLFINGLFECYTLEDVVRTGPKIPGKTAIPYGNYGLIVDRSAHFERDLPLLLGVPNFEGVRIHPGNTDADTEGCILVGKSFGVDKIGSSRDAFDRLFLKITASIEKKMTIALEIVDDRTAPAIGAVPS